MMQKANNIEIALMIRRDHIDKKKNVRQIRSANACKKK